MGCAQSSLSLSCQVSWTRLITRPTPEAGISPPSVAQWLAQKRYGLLLSVSARESESENDKKKSESLLPDYGAEPGTWALFSH